MTRAIKFRAWDTKKNKMYQPDELGQDELTINPDGRGFVNVSSTDQRLSQYMYHIIPLQFTGLTDKNGVEIYEGDILDFDFITCFSRTHGEIHEFAVASVIWVDSGAGFSLHIMKGHLHSLDMTKGKVIGNIYENPELLNKE